MIHWKRRKQIFDALEAEKKRRSGKAELSDRETARLLSYVKRHFRKTSEKKAGSYAAMSARTKGRARFSSYKDMDEYIENEKRNRIFTGYLMERLAERGLPVKGLYKLAGLHRSIKQKIELSSGLEPYRPDKNTVIKMGMAMRMTLDEMDRMLAAAGFALANNDEKDIVIRYCIERKIYDRYEIDARVYARTGKSLYKERA